MGCCGSKGEREPAYMGTNVGNNDPFGTLFDLHKGVCQVGSDSGSGTGFLCKFSIQGRRDRVHGLITNSYTLDVRDLANPFVMTFDIIRGGKKTPYEKTINPSNHFRFSCAVLDVTFVHFHQDEVDDLKSKGRIFLELDATWEGQRGEEVLIVQEQAGLKTRFTSGGFIRNHGLYLLHTSKADIGSWGSPLALKDGKVVGMHKRRAAQKTEAIDVAVSAKAIVAALSVHCKEPSLSTKLISNPVKFDRVSESRILEHDVTRCADKDNRLLIFVTPHHRKRSDETNQVGGAGGKQVQDTAIAAVVNPVWFVPTNHGWYWTPTDPFDRTQETNWMNIDTRIVVGGKDQNRRRMCNEDWKTAGWLKRTGNIQVDGTDLITSFM